MRKQHPGWSVIALVVLILVTMACALPGATPQAPQPTATATAGLSATLSSPAGTATPTAGLPVGGGNGGTGGSDGGSNGGTGGNNGGTGSNNGGSNGNEDSGGSPTQLPDTYIGPYVVKQIETLGGESISGIVCSVTKPFSVLSVTPRVTFTFYFVPQNAGHGNVSYAYTIESAGESHDAKGTYTLSPVDKAGTLQLSMSVSDHVVFKGFDGNIPNRYKFNLVPSAETTSCPAA
jgi:hypothetical protein